MIAPCRKVIRGFLFRIIAVISLSLLSPAVAQSPVQDAQAKAVKLHPDLAVKGSPLNAKFVSEYHRLQTTNPDFSTNPSWPITLAKECSDALNAPINGAVDQPTGPVDQNPKNLSQAHIQFRPVSWV